MEQVVITADEIRQLTKTSFRLPEEQQATYITKKSSAQTLRIASLIRQQKIKFTSREIAARCRVKPAIVQSIINRMKENGEVRASGFKTIRRGRLNLWKVCE